jgi:hypothetical protein
MGCLVAFPLGVVQAVVGLQSVGCSGWYIDAVAYLLGFCSGFESCAGISVCSVGVDGCDRWFYFLTYYYNATGCIPPP